MNSNAIQVDNLEDNVYSTHYPAPPTVDTREFSNIGGFLPIHEVNQLYLEQAPKSSQTGIPFSLISAFEILDKF